MFPKGIFTPNNVSDPKWTNKQGGDEFEKVLNRLVELGKKITNLRKKADESVGEVKQEFNPATQTKEQPIDFQYYDATPRPLGEVYNNRSVMSDRAIYKAREILGQQLAKLNLPASDIYLLRTDISRYAGDGTPSTGRISFQMPIMTPQGDNRTIYADVDIVLGGLQPPKYFTDGLNTKYTFSTEGVTELLRGRDFEMLQNPKVTPETVYFETPGHLASRSDMGIATYGVKKVAQEPPSSITEVMPGTELGKILDELQSFSQSIKDIKKEMEAEEKKLTKAIEQLPEKIKYKGLEKKVKELRGDERQRIAKARIILEAIEDNTAKYHKDIWKLVENVEIARTPAYKGVIGKLIQVFSQIPELKQKAIEAWNDIRSMTAIKTLVKEPVEGEPEEWEVERKTIPPVEEKLFEPTKEGVQKGIQKKAGISDYFEDILSALAEMDAVLEEAKKVVRIR